MLASEKGGGWFSGSRQEGPFHNAAAKSGAKDEEIVSRPSEKSRRRTFVDKSFLIFASLAFLTGVLCYSRGKEVFYQGLETSLSLFLDIAPRLMGAFLLAGLVEVLLPKNLITKWIGEKSGLRGIFIATLAGIFTPGGPMISFPLIAALYRMGANLAPLVSYLTSWSLLGIQRIIVWEIPFLGMKFASLRFALSLLLPIIAGLTAQRLGSHLKGDSR
jgi:uncharacterized membrane protein YraQ (UPF0718 family)